MSFFPFIPPHGYTANAVRFDGTNDYLSKTTDFTGLSDGTAGTLSFWAKIYNSDASRFYFMDNNSNWISCYRTTGNKIQLAFFDGSGFDLTLISSNSYTTSSGWFHVLASWTAGAAHLYINGASDAATNTRNSDSLDYTRGNWAVGSQYNGNEKANCDIADFWLSTTQYWDLTTASNVAKFYKGGKPVDLGSDGSNPGVTPILFLSGATASWHTNKGSGGGMTENGALTDASSSPSD